MSHSHTHDGTKPQTGDGVSSTGKRWVYSEEVRKHFFEPQNILKMDEKEYQADGMGFVGSPACGDMMKLWIKVKNDRIIDCKWQTFGCASAIGSTSMLSIMVTENGGMKLDDAMKLSPQDIVTRLHGLPDRKIHCSVLGDKALREAINDYFRKSEQQSRIIRNPARVICACLNVTDHDIEECVLEGKNTFELVQQATKAGTGCGTCIPKIEELIEMYNEKYFGE